MRWPIAALAIAGCASTALLRPVPPDAGWLAGVPIFFAGLERAPSQYQHVPVMTPVFKEQFEQDLTSAGATMRADEPAPGEGLSISALLVNGDHVQASVGAEKFDIARPPALRSGPAFPKSAGRRTPGAWRASW